MLAFTHLGGRTPLVFRCCMRARQSARWFVPPHLRSDGNLVATLMSHRMNVTQCNIAHALEKTK